MFQHDNIYATRIKGSEKKTLQKFDHYRYYYYHFQHLECVVSMETANLHIMH